MGWAANKNQVKELLKAIGLFAGHRSAWIYPGAKGQPNTADLKVTSSFFDRYKMKLLNPIKLTSVSVDTLEDGTLPSVRDISLLLLPAPVLAGFGRELPSAVFELAGDQRDVSWDEFCGSRHARAVFV